MSAIIMKMLVCLILSAIIGGIIGWLLRSLFGGEAGLKARIASLEGDLRAARDAKPMALAATGGSDEEVASLRAKLGACESEKSALLARVNMAGGAKRIPPESEWDDLELINGVGPKLEKMLYDLGVYTFREIAGWTAADIAAMDEKLPQFKGRILREGWVESAKEEHFKKYGERL